MWLTRPIWGLTKGLDEGAVVVRGQILSCMIILTDGLSLKGLQPLEAPMT
jgi:hypothetical protein